jgi:phosphoribosylformimino-5-aminoimidazole carboxamide ribotide isomerase
VTLFRPCIDLHRGLVKQIVGGSLADQDEGLRTNFTAIQPAEWFARRYREDRLEGSHLIMLGPGNEAAARAALAAWPGGLQGGGGIDADAAPGWIAAGAAKVIVTSWLFPAGRFDAGRLDALAAAVGRDRVLVDLSCRRRGADWLVATNRWQTVTSQAVDGAFLASLAGRCSELLIHAADVEGLRAGMDEELVAALGRWAPLPCTYAGGARSLEDLALVERASGGRLDLTIGSALDLFGGTVPYQACVAWNRARGG